VRLIGPNVDPPVWDCPAFGATTVVSILLLPSRLVECAPIFGALVHNAPLSALLSAQCALSAPKAPVVAPINDQVAPSFSDVLNCVSW